MTTLLPRFLHPHQTTLLVLLALLIVWFVWTILFTLTIYRIFIVLNRPKPAKRRPSPHSRRNHHLLIVLGSGGHTSEMLSILQNLGADYLNTRFARRTWVVSSGDGFSAARAREAEEGWLRVGSAQQEQQHTANTKTTSNTATYNSTDSLQQTYQTVEWRIATVHRARKIHQPLLTTPLSALRCFWDCIAVLRGTHRDLQARAQARTQKSKDPNSIREVLSPYPDLILTNGPGTAVIMVLASLALLFFGFGEISPSPDGGSNGSQGAMRSVYVESWARVRTLSLSGRILRGLVCRFLVQWKGVADVDLTVLGEGGHEVEVDGSENGGRGGGLGWGKTEYVGAVVA